MYSATTTPVPAAGNQNNQSGGPEYTYSKLSPNAGHDGNESIQRSFLLGFKYDFSERFSLNGTAIRRAQRINYVEQRAEHGDCGSHYQFTLYKENPYLPKAVVDAMTAANITSFTMSKTGMVTGPGMKNVYEHRGDRSVGQPSPIPWASTTSLDRQLEHERSLPAKGSQQLEGAILHTCRIDRYFPVDGRGA